MYEVLLLQNAHALQALRQRGLRKWHASFGTRDLQLPAPSRNNFQYLWGFLPLPGGLRDHVELNAAQVRRHAAHKRWHKAFGSYNARLDPEELTNKNAHHYCPTICAIQKKKLLNHKGSGMPRPGSAKKKNPPLPAPPLCKVGSRMLWQKRRALQTKSGLRRRHQNNIALGVGGGFRVGAFFSLAQEGAQSAL